MIRIREIDHLVLRVRDVDAMRRFYCEVLGAEHVAWRPKFGMSHLRLGRSMIDLITVDGPLGKGGGAAAGREGRNLDHFCFRVEPFRPGSDRRAPEGVRRRGGRDPASLRRRRQRRLHLPHRSRGQHGGAEGPVGRQGSSRRVFQVKSTKRLRELLARPGAIMAPGVADALNARLVKRHGFEAVYMTGAGHHRRCAWACPTSAC
jgi:catechol 2,3-dioxygenase-like lactoylglutathione lyase family enzyme